MRVLIVDDHALLRSGIKGLLGMEPRVSAVLEAASEAEAVARVREGGVDLVILDINLPGRPGLHALRMIRQLQPKLPVLIYSMHPEDTYGVQAMRLGASGYLSKQADPEEVLEAVRTIARGRRYIPVSLAERLLDSQFDGDEGPPHARLSARELEIMLMIAGGQAPAAIAEALSISTTTVSTHRMRILRKLGLKANAEIARYVVEHGLAG
ncbi:MAG: response regulator [Pseudomonadota bacterium]